MQDVWDCNKKAQKKLSVVKERNVKVEPTASSCPH